MKKLITATTLLIVFSFHFVFAQDSTVKSGNQFDNSDAYYLEYLNKMKQKEDEKKITEKKDLATANTSIQTTKKIPKPTNQEIKMKIAYLKEQNCCEEEILELEKKLEK